MGFRTGAYATVWEAKPITPSHTKIKISISYKDKNTGEYNDDFSGFVSCFGSQTAAMAASLSPRSRIKLGDCDVSTSYDKEKRVGYTNFKLFTFELLNQSGNGNQGYNNQGGNQNYSNGQGNNYNDPSANQNTGHGQVDDSQERLPF